MRITVGSSFLRLSLMGAILFGLTLTASAQIPASFFMTVNGPPDNAGGTTINGINNNGQLVGFSANAGATVLTNFIRDPNGNFTILNIGGSPTAMANGINVDPSVVGVNGNDAFLLKGGTLTVLPPANPGQTASQIAFGINDKGAIVGQYVDSVTGNTPGFLFANNAFTLFNPVPNAMVTNVQGINNNGLATGFYSLDGVHQHGFTWNTVTSQVTLLPDPVVPNLVLTQFLGINDLNETVGYYQDTVGSQHGFLFDLATNTYMFQDDPLAAPVGGVSITQITGINNMGQIAGFYIGADGVQRGFVAVPEPGALTLLAGMALPALDLLRRRLKA